MLQTKGIFSFLFRLFTFIVIFPLFDHSFPIRNILFMFSTLFFLEEVSPYFIFISKE